jgi:bidirectional [NiFe] hydrogenase diaphorase subunit
VQGLRRGGGKGLGGPDDYAELHPLGETGPQALDRGRRGTSGEDQGFTEIDRYGPDVRSPAPDGCIRCRLCIRVCKEIIGKEALRMEKLDGRQMVTPDPGRCIGCGTCANICPTQAITVSEEGGIRTVSIRGSVFGRHPLMRCQGCGKFYATEKQIRLMEERTAPHPQVKEHHNYCANCAKLFSDRLMVLEKQPPRQQTNKGQ